MMKNKKLTKVDDFLYFFNRSLIFSKMVAAATTRRRAEMAPPGWYARKYKFTKRI